jgi:glycosyltransferase involved in cell wall biosynthesis
MTSSILVTVIICTNNPRPDYLSRVLQALKVQTLPKEIWELLLVDNASEKILSTEIDLSWHSNSRHIREEQLGLTPARLRGIKESQSEVLVFVDDDNVLDVDYLEVALKISENYPFIGAWGGQIRAEFEIAPPDWTKTHWWRLAVIEFEKDTWSNVTSANTHPCGAGLCIRTVVADRYVNLTHNDSNRINLDRKGKSLSSCGDLDFAFTACDIGLGMGRFTKLKMTHLISAKRLEEDYLLALTEGNAYSQIILKSFREQISVPTELNWTGKLFNLYRLWRMSPRERRFHEASKRGECLAFKELLSF